MNARVRSRPSHRSMLASLFLSTSIVGLSCAAATVQEAQESALRSLTTSSNPHLREYAYVLLDSVWPSSKIFVCWENPSPNFQREMDLVKQEVNATWSKASSLKFTGWERCAPINKGIRIRIDDSGPHTKKLGRALDGVKEGMVLNFTFANWSSSCQQMRELCIKAIAGHEFGHAIGFAHEQNRPDKPGECKAPPQGSDGDKMLTPYDKDSIMNYCNSKWNNNGALSELDIAAVQELYGLPAPGVAKS
jgi:hypothetical protein